MHRVHSIRSTPSRSAATARNLTHSVLGALAACTIFASAHAADADAKLLNAAKHQQAPLIDTLKDMVQIESGSGNVAGLTKMANYTERRLKALGAQTERRKPTEGQGAIVIGTFTSTGTKRLMLMAHLDTVYPEGILATQPYRVDSNRIYGPGIADDKGGIALILHAVKMLNDAGWRDYAKLTILFNSDEETGSRGSGELIASLAAEHDYVFSGEPTSAKREGLLLGASGTGTVTMQVGGRSAHAGAAPEQGRNALIELAHQLLQTRDVASEIPGTQLNWTIAQSGLVSNQIPERAYARGDMRLTVADGFERMEAALRERVADKLVPDTETTISIERGRPPFVATAAAHELAKKGQDIYREIDRNLALYDNTGAATDAGFAGRSGKALVIESFGLAGEGYHARGEYIAVDSIVPRLYLLTRMMKEVAKEQ